MSQVLQTLIEYAEQQRDEAMAALLQAEDAARRWRQLWQLLLVYDASYAPRAPPPGGRAAPIDALRSHHAFMLRLQQAMAQQQALLQTAETQVQSERTLLLQREIRVAALGKLAQRREGQERRSTLRLDQQRSDEAALQRHWRNSLHSRSTAH